MDSFDRKKHWETIYQTKELNEVSWYQPTPETSLSYFAKLNVPISAKVIDIGGGDSFLVDHLLDLGYEDISVLDISEAAINRAKKRIGKKADRVKWIVSDVIDFTPSEKYDFWHDRAALHFLTDSNEIANYIQKAGEAMTPSGVLVIGTFSEKGPKKCSGIDIQQYSEASLAHVVLPFFQKIECLSIEHTTPFKTKQNFLFCSFRKNN